MFLSESGSAEFFRGKVVDLDRRTTEGFARSTVILEDLDGSDSTMRIEVQNENLIAFLDGEAVITTPNLICLLDCETFEPITTEYLGDARDHAFGQRHHPAARSGQGGRAAPRRALLAGGPSGGAAWPGDIRARVVGTTSIIEGGHEYNGREIAPLDTEAVKRLAADAVRAECRSVAVAAAFSPATSEHEIRARDLLHAELGADFPVSLSHEIGSLGLLERENATILNAALLGVATSVISGFEEALAERHLAVDAYLTQNDGTLMMAAEASQYPVLTLGSGPTNSMRGACALAGVNDAIVIDVGVTSADAGILVGGFPRQSSAAVEVGGVRTNFRMPDLISMGLGGGTIVRNAGAELRIGPDSVGYAVATDAICVGGKILTLSDVSLAAGRMTGFGDRNRVRSLDAGLVEDALGWVDAQISAMSDRMKSTRCGAPRSSPSAEAPT